MQKCRFSETQFAFQYTFEHYNKFPFSPFPFFPNTVAEGRYYGFDVCIGSLFYQFKVTDLFELSDVKSPKTMQYWNAFLSPCYTQKINTSGRQFQMMKRICSLHKYRRSVFYAIPTFHKRVDIIGNYQRKGIINESAHFSINSFPSPLSGTHTLGFTAASSYAALFSDETRVEKTQNPQRIDSLTQEKAISLYQSAKEIRELMYDFVAPTESRNLEPNSVEMNYVKETQGLLLNEFNLHWFPIIDIRKLLTMTR